MKIGELYELQNSMYFFENENMIGKQHFATIYDKLILVNVFNLPKNDLDKTSVKCYAFLEVRKNKIIYIGVALETLQNSKNNFVTITPMTKKDIEMFFKHNFKHIPFE